MLLHFGEHNLFSKRVLYNSEYCTGLDINLFHTQV
jgi:hypothetical protein